jgi:hypothetical protein
MDVYADVDRLPPGALQMVQAALATHTVEEVCSASVAAAVVHKWLTTMLETIHLEVKVHQDRFLRASDAAAALPQVGSTDA